jgi:dolichol-phosphate mannosyltransferase
VSLISVVIPTYNEKGNLPLLYERLAKILNDQTTADWEIIFTDDGSRDESMHVLESLHHADPRVRILQLVRNFGSHAAISAGLDYAGGDVVVVMTADLQEPPELIPTLLERWREGYEVVWTTRTTRKDERHQLFSRVFDRVFRHWARLPSYPETTPAGFFLLDRCAVDVFRTFGERNRMVVAIIGWMGFRYTVVPYEQQTRHAGRSGWTFAKKVNLAIDSVTSFSDKPLRWIAYGGVVLVAMGAILAVMVTASVWRSDWGGWVIAAVLLASGLQLVALAIIGQYLWRALDETRARPLYLIRRVLGFPSESHASRSRTPPRARA